MDRLRDVRLRVKALFRLKRYSDYQFRIRQLKRWAKERIYRLRTARALLAWTLSYLRKTSIRIALARLISRDIRGEDNVSNTPVTEINLDDLKREVLAYIKVLGRRMVPDFSKCSDSGS